MYENSKKTIKELADLRWDFYDKISDLFYLLNIDNINFPFNTEDMEFGNVIKISKGVIYFEDNSTLEIEDLDWEEKVTLIDELDNLLYCGALE